MPVPKDLAQHPLGRARAVVDLVHRSYAGPIGNVFAVGTLWFGTNLCHEHPVATGLYLGIMAFRLVLRVVLTLVWRRTRLGPARFPIGLIGFSAYALSAPTGLYAAFIIRHYGYGDWNTLVIYVFAMACAISGTAAIAPNLPMAIGFQVSLLLPIVLVSLSAPGHYARIVGATTSLLAVYAVIQSIRQNADYWNSVAADVALRDRAEELEAARIAADAASRAKSQFLANMSHEIRTPMNGVLGMLDLVLRSNLSAEQRQHLGYARESAQSLLGLLNDILDRSKAEAGKLELEKTDFAVREVVQTAVGPYHAQAAQKGISLSTSIDPDVPQFLKGDPTRVRQVIVNLVSNALKFTETGSIRVWVSVESLREQTTMLHFMVADTGPGIPLDKQDLIFEAFSQADGSITRRFGGTGLGLAICRDLVKLMGGRIWLESQPGRGSTFHFTAGFAPSSGIPLAEPLPEPAAKGCGPLRVLVAEDNLINQKLLGHMLKIGGHSFEIAENGQQAVSRSRERRFDVILMDVQMPGMDGLEATRRIRASEGASGPRLPIIGVTAGATAAELASCLASGMDSCITKPLAIREVEEVLARVSAGRPLASAVQLS
jgi:signal transduction histidine kinase/CheY-like chemotaxis protein